ncbi:CPBP family intramembrane glutamic endopeptidase [Natronobacterium texcoconense]|uniref:CAAX prenyl protease 2/Lysostaphin resistance protein A-like domain-containing protein n=1 Tax=Natronobacterium texcoconense TaxID=1095778 RepID=A0A1H1BDA0_NATTX|nr:type II CAAX endopeptidase family protein [Natronobacterium texcoconense]SDQ49366.1 hypothetical protein SAMN04489842_0992 [Natronobacterium texcoconense]
MAPDTPTTDRVEPGSAGSWARRRRRLERTVEPLVDCSLEWVLALPFVPIAFTAFVMTAGITANQGADPGWPQWALIVPLGVAYAAIVYWLYREWDRATWRAAVVVRKPSTDEIGAALLATLVGIAIVVVGNNAAETVGLAPHDRGLVTSGAGIAALVFGTVVVAPIAEEILFRGLVLGHLVARGYGIVAASILSVLLFALVHVFMAGVVSIVVTGLLGALLTVLRLWYDNLVGAWLMHLSINVWGLLVTVGVVPVLW